MLDLMFYGRHKKIAALVLVAALALLLQPTLFAQQTGQITGTVVDATGAVIPNAKVVLTNVATKDTRKTVSNGAGVFVFSGAVAGDYGVKVELAGFKSVEQSGIHLGPGDRRTLNVTLAVGAADEVITVEASQSQIQVSTSGDLTATLFATDIKNLGLQGRDATELVKTLPGFSINTSYNGIRNQAGYDTNITSIGSAVGRGLSANGVPDRSGGTDLVSDGAHIVDAGCNCNANQTVNADMVQELKVTTSAYGADNMTGPVVISAVSKSGSDQYHGSGYFHFRDSAMNSNDWNYNYNKVAKPSDRYMYPGGQIGGPVPFTNKKLIFFTGYEYYNQSFPEQTSNGIIKAMVPTMSERAGLFDPALADNAAVCSAIQGWISGQYRCQPITSISTANGYVGGIVNSDISNYLAPGGLALLKMIPEPNRTPTSATPYNYVQPLLNTNNGYMFHTRVDYNFNDSTKLYVSYNQQHENYGTPLMRWWMAGNSIAWPGAPSSSNLSRTISGNFVKVFNSTTTNEFIVAVSYLHVPEAIGNEKAVDKVAQGYPYKYPDTMPIMPSIMNAWWTNDFGIPMMLDTGRVDYFERKLQPSFTDNFTMVRGRHTLKAGVSWLRSGNKGSSVDQMTGRNGTITYGPIWDFSGPEGSQVTSSYNPVLDLMLDHVAGFSYRPVPVTNLHNSSLGFYGQDEWRATKRLTLTYGLRLTHDAPWEDATGKYGVPAFKQAWYDTDRAAGITNLPGLRWHAIDKSIPLAGRTLDAIFVAPRFGVNYDLFGNGKTTLRGGIGLYYYPDGLQGSPGTSIPMGGTSCGTTGSAFLSEIDAGGKTACAATGGGLTDAQAIDPSDHSEPRSLLYSFTVSQQTTANSFFEVTYSGSQSENLLVENDLKDINKIPLGAFMKPDPNPESSRYNQYIPINEIKDNILQDFHPLTHYKRLDLFRHKSWANYNSLQISWQKNRGPLTYNLNYSFSKALGIDKTPDPININNDYGILSQDRTHVFKAAYTYDVGRRFKSNRFAGAALNGWMISGFTALQSGVPLQAGFSQNFNLGGKNGPPAPFDTNTVSNKYYLGTDGYTLMPVLTCNPTQGLQSGQYINPNCFALPTAPQFDANGVMTQLGGQGRYQWPYLRGPAYFTSDLSLGKTISITERQNVQIKFSAINFLNHPLKSFDQSAANNINLNFNEGVLTTSGAGWKYGVPNQKYGRRVLEMTLRYNF